MALKSVSDEEFVRLWQTYEGSVHELAASLGVKTEVLTNKACYLRSRGVPLRRFPRNGHVKHIKNLKKIAKEHKA